jgi:YtoQ family protein
MHSAGKAQMNWTVYLAGEIHTNWRTELHDAARSAELPVEFVGPVTDHDASDNCGAEILGEESNPFWRDRKGAGVNSIRTRTMLQRADIVIVKFGDKYRQWNAAFDAGAAVTLNKPLIAVHPPELQHALKEIDASASAVAETIDQVVEILRYVTQEEAWQG